MSLENRNLILKREGDYLVLPSVEYLACEAPSDIPNERYMLFRVERFDEQIGELELKHEKGKWDEKSFAISIEVNSDDLIAANIKNVIIVKPKTYNYLTSKNFNNDINLHQRLTATATSSEENFSNTLQSNQPARPQPHQQTLSRKIYLPIKDIILQDEKASFQYFFDPLIKERTFEIANSHIKKEFDAIKNYFAKALGLKRFEFHVKLILVDGVVVDSYVTSPHIDLINENLLEQVAENYIEHEIILGNEEVTALEDKLSVVNAILSDEENKDANWLLEKIFSKSQTKHYIHLRYLSSKQKADDFKLSITGKPLSFIFLLESKGNYFLIWETYNTDEATYLWKIEGNNAEDILSETEDIIEKIKWLRKGNKLAYINSKPKNFKRLEHEYVGADFGFKKWQMQLIEFINT